MEKTDHIYEFSSPLDISRWLTDSPIEYHLIRRVMAESATPRLGNVSVLTNQLESKTE